MTTILPIARVDRLHTLINESHMILQDTLSKYFTKHRVAGIVLMWSGGNDSNTLAHLMRPYFTHAAHANTGIGIERTRQHVRDTCESWGLPLIEKHPPVSYATLVAERGFPGPAQHYKMYQRLKERCFRQVRAELVTNPRKERVLFIAGRRREESARRAGFNDGAPIPAYEREGSTVWCSPMVNWTKFDINTYRMLNPETPHNEVSDLLHMSGECLCGAFAKRGELDEIKLWFPDVAEYINKLSECAKANGVTPERCVWGWGAYRSDIRRSKVGKLCGSCASLTEVPS